MKRSAFDQKRDQMVADEATRDVCLPCNVCGAQTPRSTLSDFGSQCFACYGKYCAEKNPSWLPNRSLNHDERASIIRKAQRGLAAVNEQKDKRRWAYLLRDREEAGEKLTIAQREAWRAVIGRKEV